MRYRCSIRRYQFSVLIGYNASQMRPFEDAFDSCVSLKIICANLLDPSWLDTIRQQSWLNVWSASDNKLKVPGTTRLYLHMDASRRHVNSGVIRQLVVSVLLRCTLVDRFIKSLSHAEGTGARRLEVSCRFTRGILASSQPQFLIRF